MRKPVTALSFKDATEPPGEGAGSFPADLQTEEKPFRRRQNANFFEETGLHTRINSLLDNYSYPGEANIIIVYISEIIGGRIRPCPESMSINEFKKEEIPWSRLAFDTTRNAFKKYIKEG